MNSVRYLHELQHIDLEIDARVAAIERIDERLRTDDSIPLARAVVESRESEVRAAQSALPEIEAEESDLNRRLASIDKGLRVGGIKNQSQLSHMEEERSRLLEEKSLLEERELEAMLADEAAGTGLAEARAELVRAEQAWAEESANLSQERIVLEAEIAELHRQRTAHLESAAGLDTELLAKYERLRKTRRGLAVAVVENGMCSGCRESLPKATLQECRSGQRVVYCSCGRILYAPH
ncbi:MAG: hypothetical protein M1319_05385 [Chloroflexi bacterium]|nr:hypothetical protein [Chloroflexota bacterium]